MNQPASLAQVQRLRDGRVALVDGDVLDIARRIKEIDPTLHLMYSETSDCFWVEQRIQEGDRHTTHLVTTSQHLDQRLLERVREITQPGYDIGKDLDRQEQARDKLLDDKQKQDVGEKAERLYHELRRVQGKTSRAYVPGD